MSPNLLKHNFGKKLVYWPKEAIARFQRKKVLKALNNQPKFSFNKSKIIELEKMTGRFPVALNELSKLTHTHFLHNYNVARLSIEMAKELGLTKKEIERTGFVGLHHDLGKLGAPEIYFKGATLIAKEKQEMKEHPYLSAKIAGKKLLNKIQADETAVREAQVKDVEKLKENSLTNVEIRQAINEIYAHHEQPNGKGYFKMKEKEVSEVAKIVGIADHFISLMEARVYRHPKQFSETKKILINESKTGVIDRDIFKTIADKVEVSGEHNNIIKLNNLILNFEEINKKTMAEAKKLGIKEAIRPRTD